MEHALEKEPTSMWVYKLLFRAEFGPTVVDLTKIMDFKREAFG